MVKNLRALFVFLSFVVFSFLQSCGEQPAKASLSVQSDDTVTTGKEVVVSAGDSFYSEISWSLDGNSQAQCEGKDSCSFTFSEAGDYRVEVTVEAGGSSGAVDLPGTSSEKTKDSADVVISVQASEVSTEETSAEEGTSGSDSGSETTTTTTSSTTSSTTTTTTSTSPTTTLAPDNQAPFNTSVVINNGASVSYSTDVTLTLSASDDKGVVAYIASIYPTVPTVSSWYWKPIPSVKNFSANIPFFIYVRDGNTYHKTVNVWFKDAAGNISSMVSDSIEMTLRDVTPPQFSLVSINDDAISSSSFEVTVKIEATDDEGVTGYIISTSPEAPGPSAPWQEAVGYKAFSISSRIYLPLEENNPSNHVRDVYVWLRDEAGNISEAGHDTIVLDSIPPKNTIAGISIADSELELNVLNGSILLYSPIDSRDLTHFVLYWGANAVDKLNDTPIVAISKQNSGLEYKLQNVTKPPGATHIIVHSKNQWAEMAVGKSAPIVEAMWDLAGSGLKTDSEVRDLIYAKNQFMIVGNNGLIATSGTGYNWTHQLGTSNSLSSVAYGSSQYMAVSSLYNVYTAYTSEKGSIWEQVPSTPGLRSIVYGNSKFVATGYNNAYTRVGNSWDSYQRWYKPVTRIDFENTLFWVMGEGGTLASSSDGIRWNDVISNTTETLHGMVYGNNTYVIVGTGGTILTSNGGAWSPQNSGTIQTLYDVAYGNGHFMAVGENGTILHSTDAVNWTPQAARSLADYSTKTERDLNRVVYGNGGFVVTADADWNSTLPVYVARARY